MAKARIHIDAPVSARDALARAQALLHEVDDARPVLLYGAVLHGASVALGAHQHAPHALRAEAFEALALPVLRRRSGGAAVWASQGVLYFGLGLRDASALLPCPPGKLLNRNVRGLLSGLRALGVPANYFGRDFVAFGKDPGAYLGWAESEDGRVWLEAFVALDTVFTPADELSGYPARREPALRGKTPTTLRAAGVTWSATEILRALADGYTRAFALEPEEGPASEAELALAAAASRALDVDLHADFDLSWSAPHEEAIGFVSAGVALDERGRLRALRLGGDFFAREGCETKLRELLQHATPTPERVGAALDAVYVAVPGAIEGVRSLDTLRSAILDAAERARPGG